MKYVHIGLLAVIVIGTITIAIPISLIFFQQTREASRKAEVGANLKAISEALAQDHDRQVDPYDGPSFDKTRPEAIRQASKVLAEQLNIPAEELPTEEWRVNFQIDAIKVSGKVPPQKPDISHLVDFELVFHRAANPNDTLWHVTQLILDGKHFIDHVANDATEHFVPPDVDADEPQK